MQKVERVVKFCVRRGVRSSRSPAAPTSPSRPSNAPRPKRRRFTRPCARERCLWSIPPDAKPATASLPDTMHPDNFHIAVNDWTFSVWPESIAFGQPLSLIATTYEVTSKESDRNSQRMGMESGFLKEKDPLHEGLVAILAWRPDRSPRAIGTAFIVASYGSHAVAISAAHNFHMGVRTVQRPSHLHHPTALMEFLPNAEVIDLDGDKLRALYIKSDRAEFCIIDFLAWDQSSDLAILTIRAQDHSGQTLFDKHAILDHARPKVGDIITVLGYVDMATFDEYRDGEVESFTAQGRLMLRAGRVKRIHPEGHALCRGPCVETTIPVFFGMSGGPACLAPEPNAPVVPFGFISTDLDESDAFKNDRSRAGSSIIGLLPHEISDEAENKRNAMFRLANVSFVRNTEFDRQTS